MNDLLVISGATCEYGTLPLYRKQLADAGIEHYVEQLNPDDVGGSGGNLAYKVKMLRKWANQFSHYERLVFTDAFDVTFYGTKEELIKKVPIDYVLWAAEKNCYPELAIADRIAGDTPWRYANGGCLCGSPQSVLDWCSAAESHPIYAPAALDQWFYNQLLMQGDPLIHIDSHTELFFCLFLGYSELEFEKGKPINTLCGTSPLFLHANGKWSQAEMWDKYEASLR